VGEEIPVIKLVKLNVPDITDECVSAVLRTANPTFTSKTGYTTQELGEVLMSAHDGPHNSEICPFVIFHSTPQ
jgi:hypothetical protein